MVVKNPRVASTTILKMNRESFYYSINIECDFLIYGKHSHTSKTNKKVVFRYLG